MRASASAPPLSHARPALADGRAAATSHPFVLPHLATGLLATLLVAAALVAGLLEAQARERRFAPALAPEILAQKNQGVALQAAIARQPDLLLLFGSSEFFFGSPNRPFEFFGAYQTGFQLAPLGTGGSSASLERLQDVAALGPALRGRRLVILVGPGGFLFPTARHDEYAGNFSRLHANELAFGTALDGALKQAVARRMLVYPETLEQDPVLRLALQALAADGPAERALYALLLPLGRLQTLLLEAQDHLEVLLYLRAHPGLEPDVPHRAAAPDWDALADRAEREQVAHSTSNPYGLDDQRWADTWRERAATRYGALDDKAYLRYIAASAEWGDLELLLRTLRQLGAEPLFIGIPYQGAYEDSAGLSARARGVYYARLGKVLQDADVAYSGFADHDDDRSFLVDPGDHLSRKGWIYVDRAIDAFVRHAGG